MALDDDTNDDETADTTDGDNSSGMENAGVPLTDVNSDAPAFVKDIKARQSKRFSDIPLNMDVQYLHNNSYAMDGSQANYKSSSDIKGVPTPSGFIDTAEAEAFEMNSHAKALSAARYKDQEPNPIDDPAPPDWNPKTDQENFINVKPENLGYVLAATGPKDQAFRLQRVQNEQAIDNTLANGSFAAKVIGGLVGMITDPATYIPVGMAVKTAKLGSTFLNTAKNALPGVATYSAIQAGADNAEKTSKNLSDFFTDAFTDTVFGTALFGVGGIVAPTVDKMGLWNLRKTASSYFDGVDFNLATNDKGEITGYKAVDSTGSLSAAKVSFAQDLADSTFANRGIFKIPYVGAGVSKALEMKIPGTQMYFGSQLQSLLTSPYKTLRGFIDRTADHSMTTTGIAGGNAAPDKFASLLQQSMANFRSLSTQINALHLERNGFDISNRPLGGIVNAGLNLQSKALNVLSKDMDKSEYVSKNDFYGEIENVLLNNANSQHAPVNDAARMIKTHQDEVYGNYRKAYNLPEDWLPPKTARGYLMRVYDTPYMNANKSAWTGTISKWLSDADDTITNRMQPINDLSDSIKEFEGKHTQAVHILANIDNKKVGGPPKSVAIERGTTINPAEPEKELATTTTELQPGSPEHTLHSMRIKLKAMKETLQNQLRYDPDMQLHVDDWNALSADEGKALSNILAPSKQLEKQVADQKQVLSEAKKQASQKLSSAKNTKTVEKAIPKSKKYAESKGNVTNEEEKLRELQAKLDTETDRLQDLAHKGEINPRYYTRSADGLHYEFKDPNNRLKFRDTYNTQAEREVHAKAYYDTIMNQSAEQTINQVMGKFMGNQRENPIKARTLLVPDHILYDNNFMSKDLMAKVANYTSYLSRRTHLKTVFNDVSVDGGIESLVNELHNEYQAKRTPLDNEKAELQAKAKENPDDPAIQKQMKAGDKELTKHAKEFDIAKNQMNHIYNKMMGINSFKHGEQQARSIIMSLTAIGNLPFVPFTQVNDLSAVGLQHGIWPFIRDGVLPTIESIGGLLKSKDSQSLRETAPSVHLALQDTLNGYADRNWGAYTNPYLNLGRIAKSLENVAHISSNFTGTNYIDNGIQRLSAATAQSEFMRILFKFKEGTMTPKEGIYIRKYGIQPEDWADRMTEAFKQDGGGKTKYGGYQSLAHQWQDLPAANKFGSAIFRAVKDTNLQAGLADSPFWTDSILGSIIKGFNGWTYASINRYVIPSMQEPDAQKFLGVMFMLGMGALVDPMRRWARGEDAYPDNITDKQKMWAAVYNSGYFSGFADTLAAANMFSGDRLLGDLKSDKYVDRTRAGLLGPAWGQFNKMTDVVGMLASREYNKNDVNKIVRMMPFANATWTYWMSKKLVDSLDIPKTRAQAHLQKENS